MTDSTHRPLTIAVDFDGVINNYQSEWAGPTVLPDPPVPGAFEFLSGLVADGCRVVIHSCRLGGWDVATGLSAEKAIQSWMLGHGLAPDVVAAIEFATGRKPHADVYIDDRAWRFEGRFPSLDELERLRRPWNKKVEVYAVVQLSDGTLFSTSRFESDADAEAFIAGVDVEKFRAYIYPRDLAEMSAAGIEEVENVIEEIGSADVTRRIDVLIDQIGDIRSRLQLQRDRLRPR